MECSEEETIELREPVSQIRLARESVEECIVNYNKDNKNVLIEVLTNAVSHSSIR
jgi:hypothetical protein